MKTEYLTRQLDIIPMEWLETPVTIVGAGAIGSWTCLSLAKMGFRDITVFDDDKITEENMNSQFFPIKDIGRHKVIALSDLVEQFTGTKIKSFPARWSRLWVNPTGIMISAVDSMKSRKEIWDGCRDSIGLRFIIDPRMGALDAALYTADLGSDRCGDYEKSLRDDDDSVSERCTAKSTIFTASLISGLTAKAVLDALGGNILRSAQWSIEHHDLIAFRGGSNAN